MKTPRVSIVLPVRNRASLTRQCLDWLLATDSKLPYEIIVVDDASTDSTPSILQRYRDRIRVVTHADNTGYATSCNDGAAAASSDSFLFFNNDLLGRPGWLDALTSYSADHPKAAVVGAKLLFPDATIQHAGVVISHDRIPRHVYAGFPADHPAVNKSRRFQIVTAACSLITRDAFEALGGFDTDFINGYEDVDFCLRLGEHGHEVHFCHLSELYHLESATRGSAWYDQNSALYLDRWAPRVRPDEFDYYVADGLVKFEHWERYPFELSVSPLLASLSEDDDRGKADRITLARARQAFLAYRENTRLRVLAHEWEALGDDRLFTTGDSSATATRIVAGRTRRLGGKQAATRVSIVMPVKNVTLRLEKLLPRLFEQRAGYEIELIAVDSGSTDDSVAILKEAGATVLSIDPRSFNHGLTRQLGANHAHGDVIVFLNSTAMPADRNWLANLVAPLRNGTRLAGVCSRVVPPPDADLLARREMDRDLSGSSQRSIREITDWAAYQALSPDELRAFVNFHTVSAAIRPNVLREVPFREVLTIGEDIQWAKDVLEAGYQLQHEPTSAVFHYHNYSHREILMLNVDDGVANHEVVGRTLNETDLFPLITTLTTDDWRFLREDCGLEGDDLERWQIEAALRRSAQIVGQWIGAGSEQLPRVLRARLSRVAHLRKGASHDAARA